MNRSALIVGLLVIVVGLQLVLAWGSSARQGPLTVNPRTGNFMPVKSKTRSTRTPPLPPKAVIESTVHHFGMMNAQSTDSHTFMIRNEGPGPLKLSRGGTTCKCTEFKILDSVVPPGGEAGVVVAWKTVRDHGTFYESANIRTNDRKNPSIQLRVRGEIKTRIGFEPQQLNINRVKPGNSQTAYTFIYSQHWKQFSVASITSTLPGLTWEIEDAKSEDLKPMMATSGYRIKFTTPDNLETGLHSHRVRFQIRSNDDDAEPEDCELGIVIKVLRRLAIYGPAIDSNGVVTLGRSRVGQGCKVRLLVKVHDDDSVLRLKNVESAPSFVRTRIVALPANDKIKGLYHLHIEIPNDAPECHHTDRNMGQLNLSFDHPRISNLSLQVSFSVSDEGY